MHAPFLRNRLEVEPLAVVPVRLHDALRHPFQELVLVPPQEIAPYPRAHAKLLDSLDEEVEVMPPEFPLAHGAIGVFVLVSRSLLVVAEMEEARLVEYLAHVADHVGAHSVVFRRRDHASIFLEPRIVRSGEVELRDRLQAHAAQPRKLLAHLLGVPRSLYGKFGMARIEISFANVDHDGVEAALDHPIRQPAPHGLVKPEAFLRTHGVEVLFLGKAPAVHLDVAPHVVPQLKEHPAKFFCLFVHWLDSPFMRLILVRIKMDRPCSSFASAKVHLYSRPRNHPAAVILSGGNTFDPEVVALILGKDSRRADA